MTALPFVHSWLCLLTSPCPGFRQDAWFSLLCFRSPALFSGASNHKIHTACESCMDLLQDTAHPQFVFQIPLYHRISSKIFVLCAELFQPFIQIICVAVLKLIVLPAKFPDLLCQSRYFPYLPLCLLKALIFGTFLDSRY